MAIKNVTLTVNFLAWDTSANVGKTGDNANFTMRLIKDGGTPAAPTNALSEPDATNLPGTYELVLTATEMNADFVTLGGLSSTASVEIIPISITTEGGTIAVIDGNVDSILVDTADMQPKLGTPADTDMSTDILNVQTGVDGIGTAGGAAINIDANTSNEGGGITGVTSATTIVGTPTNTYTATSVEDGTYHVMTHATNAIDVVYQFLTGGGTEPVAVVWTGYLTSANDACNIRAWNHVGGAWEIIGTITGSGGTTNQVFNPILYPRHRGASAAEFGKIYIRIDCTGQTSPVLNTDQLYVQYSVTAKTVGYANGAVWGNTVSGTAGTESFVNGVADNPSDSLADMVTIAANLSLHNFEFSNDSSITFVSGHADHDFKGKGYTLALGGQDCVGSHMIGATVSGTATSSGDEMHFTECEMGTCTLGAAHLENCGLTDTITLSQATTYTLQTCHSEVAGSATPIIDFGAAIGNTSLNMRRYAGGIEIQNMGATGTDTMSLDGNGALVINANCTGGTLVLRGDFDVTDNSGGALSITYDDNTSGINSILVDTGTTIPAVLGTPAGADMSTDIASLQTDTTAILVDTASFGIPKNAIFNDFEFPMVLTSDHYTAATAKSVTGEMSIDGAAFASTNGTIAEVGSGVYQIDLTADDTNGDVITYKFSATDCDDTIITVTTRA